MLILHLVLLFEVYQCHINAISKLSNLPNTQGLSYRSASAPKPDLLSVWAQPNILPSDRRGRRKIAENRYRK